MMEIFFRVLKSGCRVEERRFEAMDRLLPCLAVYLIVAWRVLYLCRLGRSCPEISCEAVFEPAEWKSVYVVVRREPPPKVAPKLQEMIRLVAQLGGYVNRKRDDEPGPQTCGWACNGCMTSPSAGRSSGPVLGRRRPPSERRPNLCRTTRASAPGTHEDETPPVIPRSPPQVRATPGLGAASMV